MALLMYINGTYTFNDGFQLSLYGSDGAYCKPRRNIAIWHQMDVRILSDQPEAHPVLEPYREIQEWLEDEDLIYNTHSTAYCHVPVFEVIPLLEEKHGKIVSIEPYHSSQEDIEKLHCEHAGEQHRDIVKKLTKALEAIK